MKIVFLALAVFAFATLFSIGDAASMGKLLDTIHEQKSWLKLNLGLELDYWNQNHFWNRIRGKVHEGEEDLHYGK